MKNNHIVEIKCLDLANKLISQDNYRLERYSESRDCYILVKRIRG